MDRVRIAGLTSSLVIALQVSGCGGNDDGPAPAPPPVAVQKTCTEAASFALPNVSMQAPQAGVGGTPRPARVPSGDFLPAPCLRRGVAGDRIVALGRGRNDPTRRGDVR